MRYVASSCTHASVPLNTSTTLKGPFMHPRMLMVCTCYASLHCTHHRVFVCVTQRVHTVIRTLVWAYNWITVYGVGERHLKGPFNGILLPYGTLLPLPMHVASDYSPHDGSRVSASCVHA
jgi:hypothetical protein